MFTVRQVLQKKGDAVHTVTPGATVLEAAQLMNRHRIGSLVVVGGVGGGESGGEKGVVGVVGVEGIITERDLLTRIITEERAPSKTTVGEVMTRDLLVCSPQTPLEDLRCTMREKRIRHIPVLESGRLVGMISIGDINAAEEQTLVETITHLETYITR
jgi:CBS domain-containing protein